MKTTQLFTTFAALALLVVPTLSLASTYQYINTAGNLQSIEASNASVAMAIAPNIAFNSGVILASNYDRLGGTVIATTPSPTQYTGTGGSNVYAYVANDGAVKYVVAATAERALATAVDIKSNSGVQLMVK